MVTDDKIRDENDMILLKKQQKYQHYHLEKLINMNILQMKKYYPSNQGRVIETAKFAYSPLSKTFERQIIAIEHQGEKQKRAVEDHGKQLVESNELIKEDFNIGRDNIPLEEQNKIFKYLMILLKKSLLNLGV